MKKTWTIIPAAMLGMAAVVFGVSSCGKTENEGSDDNTETPIADGQTIYVPAAAGESVTVSAEFTSEWYVSNACSWFSVDPLRGDPGVAELTVTVLESNSDLKEKEASFLVREGDSFSSYNVVQDAVPGFSEDNYTVKALRGEVEVTVTVEGNVEFDAVPEADWITVTDIRQEHTKLKDGQTDSKYMVSEITLKVKENTGEVRDGRIVLTATDNPEVATAVTVSQMGDMTADFSREFLRKSVVMRFTATWCGFCPLMNIALHDAMEADPGHIVGVSMYSSLSGGALGYDMTDTYSAAFGISGFPTAIVNDYAQVDNYSSTSTTQSVFQSLADEAAEILPANTSVGGSVEMDGEKLEVSLYLASKEAGDYHVSVFILEDGIIHEQNGGSNNYEHTNVALDEMTGMWGDSVSLPANGNTRLSFSSDIPSTAFNPENIHVLVIVNREGTFTGKEALAGYHDYGYVTDNAVDIPVNSFVEYEYEN